MESGIETINHPDTAECLFNLTMVHLQTGETDAAIAFSERGAVVTARPAKGSAPDFAVCLTQAAQLLARKREARKTEDALRRTLIAPVITCWGWAFCRSMP